MAFVIECTETAFWNHMLSTMQVASFSQQAAYGHTSTFIRLQEDTVQHAVQFGVASCRAATHSKQRNATMLTSHKGPFTLDVRQYVCIERHVKLEFYGTDTDTDFLWMRLDSLSCTVTFTRVHVRIPNGQTREDPHEKNRACRVDRQVGKDCRACPDRGPCYESAKNCHENTNIFSTKAQM